MADALPPSSSPVRGDDDFDQFQERLLSAFAAKFDSWLIRARAVSFPPRRQGGTLGDLLSLSESQVDSDAICSKVEIIWDLAELCRNFVEGDLWAYAFLQRRLGLSSPEAVRAAVGRVTQSQMEAHDRKWTLGLRAIEGIFSGSGQDFPYYLAIERLEDTPLARSAWAAVVEEAIPSYIEKCLKPALAEREISATLKEAEAVIDRLSRRSSMDPAVFLEQLRERRRPAGTESPRRTIPSRVVTGAVIAWRRKTVKSYRNAKDLKVTDLARRFSMDASVIRAIIREDRRASKCTDVSRNDFLQKLEISVDDWYAPRD